MASFEERKQVFVDFVNDVEGYELVNPEQFVNSKTKVDMKHVECGCVWDIRPNDFKNGGYRCPECAKKVRTAGVRARAGKPVIHWNNEKIQSWLDENKPGWKIVGEYKNAKTPVEFTCDKGHQIFMRWRNIKDVGNGCGVCSQQVKTKTTAQFEREMIEASDCQYVLVSEYINNYTKVDLLHLTCGEIYSVVPRNFLSQGHRCGCESESRGQKAMRDILQAKGFNFAEEVRFDQCRYKNPLPFDFVVYKEDNKTIDFIVEVDGEFHRKSIMGSDLKETQLRDAIKTRYCEENNIPLLRIEYNDSDTSSFKQELEIFLNG